MIYPSGEKKKYKDKPVDADDDQVFFHTDANLISDKIEALESNTSNIDNTSDADKPLSDAGVAKNDLQDGKIEALEGSNIFTKGEPFSNDSDSSLGVLTNDYLNPEHTKELLYFGNESLFSPSGNIGIFTDTSGYDRAFIKSVTYKNGLGTVGNDRQEQCSWSFYFDGSDITLLLRPERPVLIEIDGVMLSKEKFTPDVVGDTIVDVNLNLGERKLRKITIHLASSVCAFSGVKVKINDTISPIEDTSKKVILIGDSFSIQLRGRWTPTLDGLELCLNTLDSISI